MIKSNPNISNLSKTPEICLKPFGYQRLPLRLASVVFRVSLSLLCSCNPLGFSLLLAPPPPLSPPITGLSLSQCEWIGNILQYFTLFESFPCS